MYDEMIVACFKAKYGNNNPNEATEENHEKPHIT
jgi:hypothetical protein